MASRGAIPAASGAASLLGSATAGAFLYGGIFACVAGTPFAYIGYYQVPPQLYGLLFGASVIGIMVTNVINVRLVGRLGIVRMLRAGRRWRHWRE